MGSSGPLPQPLATDVPTLAQAALIHVNQTDPYINASIPTLTQNYSNTSFQNEAKATYQVAYYNFPQFDYVDIGTGEARLAVSITFAPNYLSREGPSAVTPHTFDTAPVIPLRLLTNTYTNASEIAQAINSQLKEQNVQLKISGLVMPMSPTSAVLAAFADAFDMFYFDNSSLKYMIQLKSRDLQYNIDGYGLLQAVKITLELRTLGTTIQDASLIKALGGSDTPSARTYFDTYSSVSRQGYIASFQPNITLLSATVNTQLIGVNGTQQQVGIPYVDIIIPGINVPSIFQSKYVYVRTNINSNGWQVSSNPLRSDILAVLPRLTTSDTSELASMFFPSSLFAVTDTIAKLKTLRLRLTDEDGTLLTFNAPYQLGILISPTQSYTAPGSNLLDYNNV